jgi:pimeloyl-ACP methyl ester carboxylesterase
VLKIVVLDGRSAPRFPGSPAAEHRCREWAVGGSAQEPAPVAPPLWRPRHGTVWLPVASASTLIVCGASLPLIQSRLARRRANTTPGLCAAWRDARRLQPVRCLRPGRYRQQGFVAQGKLTMPVLAVGGEKSFGPTIAVVMRAAATDVHELIIGGSGHRLMEEQPVATVAAVRAFLDQQY